MIYETHCENVKNSDGEASVIRHYIIDTDQEAASLPLDAPIGSDALSKTAVYVKFSDEWVKI